MAEHEDLPFLYTSGELEASDKASFEAHLSGCRDCRGALEDLAWSSRIAGAAALRPSAGLVIGALARTRGTLSWSPWDWTRALGFGLGLALAAGLFIVRLSGSNERDFAWKGTLDSEMSDVSGKLDKLDSSLSREGWSVEFKESWDDLSRQQRALERQLARPEGA